MLTQHASVLAACDADTGLAHGFTVYHLPVVADFGQLVGMLPALNVVEWIAPNVDYRPVNGQKGQVVVRPPER